MKRNLTIPEVLRELRAQVKAHKSNRVLAQSAIAKEQSQHAIDALTITIRYICQGERSKTNG